jgi:hypothetical protein
MPTVKEINIQLENKPGRLARVCNALNQRKVNIIGFQVSMDERKSQVHLVVDNPSSAKSILDAEGLTYTENGLAQIALAHRAGELARVASQLAGDDININYAYAGLEPATNAPLVFFGVDEVGRAAKVLDKAAAAGAGR